LLLLPLTLLLDLLAPLMLKPRCSYLPLLLAWSR
jgi:hypothetical protein